VGIYDRDYLRDEYEQRRPGFLFPSPRSMTVALIVVNVAIYLANFLFFPPQNPKDPNDLGWLSGVLSATNLTLMRPWLWWQFLTYGFVHASPGHIFFNMLGLFFLGRAVEEAYGQKEYLRIYLTMIVAGGVVWAASLAIFFPDLVFHAKDIGPGLVGASGAVTGIVMLFILGNPQATLIMFPIPIPIKAWIVGVFLIVGNVLGAVSMFGQTAWGVHLTGIVFAYLYFRGNWRLGNLFQGWFHKPNFLTRPKFRVHRPPDEDSEPLNLSDEVDRILDKIHKQGESSLTKQERRMLEIASQKYQKRKKD
jgi:membrane associated rhomboid family serine protease